MVKLVRDFLLSGEEPALFRGIRDKLPLCYPEGEYKILEEIVEEDRLYRNALLRRQSSMDMIPSFIKESLPNDFVHTVTSLKEEMIFYNKEHKIHFSIECEYDDVYSIAGSIRFIQLEKGLCKVAIILHFELHDLKKYIENEKIRAMAIPLLESKIPDIFVENLQTIYSSVAEGLSSSS